MKKKFISILVLTFGMIFSSIFVFTGHKHSAIATGAAASYPAANEVSFVDKNGTRHYFSDSTYYNNKGEKATNSDYTIKYISSGGTLFLKGFEGNQITCTSSEELSIYMESGDNVISPKTEQLSFYTLEYKALYGIKSTSNVHIAGVSTAPLIIESEDYSSDTNFFYGIWSHEGSVTIDTNANVQMKIEAIPRWVRGIFAYSGVEIRSNSGVSINSKINDETVGIGTNKGPIKISSSKDLKISFDSTDSERTAFGIRNYGASESDTGNGDITFSGSGKVQITTENLYGTAVYTRADNSTIKLDKATVEIEGFKVGISNENKKVKPAGAYNIEVLNDSELHIRSDCDSDTSYGLNATANGILIKDSDYRFKGYGLPIKTVNTYSYQGLDVKGECYVDLMTDRYIDAGSCISNIDLSGYGYFSYTDLIGNLPDLENTNFYIKLGKSTYFSDIDEWYSTSASGYDEDAMFYEPYDPDENPYFMLECMDMGKSTLKVNGVELTESKPYYKNGESQASDSEDGRNAEYNPNLGILYLSGYNSGPIILEPKDDEDVTLKIYVETDSKITGSEYGVYATGGNVEMLGNSCKLEIVVNSDSGNASGILVEDGDLTIRASLTIILDVASTGNKYARGLSVPKGYCILKQSAVIDAKISSISTIGNDAGIFADTVKVFDDVEIKIDTSGVSNGAYCVNCTDFNFVEANSVYFKWKGDKGPYYPTDTFDDFSNVTINKQIVSGVGELTLVMGTPVQGTIVNGASNRYENKFAEGEVGVIGAYQFENVPFDGWTSDVEMGILDASQSVTLISAPTTKFTLTANYKITKNKPVFDSKGTDDQGNILFEMNGSPETVRLVGGDDNYDKVVVNPLDPKTTIKKNDVPTGTYKIAAKYKDKDGVDRWLYSEKFNVQYGGEQVKYDVSYYKDDSTLGETVQTVSGSMILPVFNYEAPEGKTFKAWALGSVSGTQYKAGDSYELYSDVSFYPVFENKKACTISFDIGEGSGSMDNVSFYEGDSYTLPECTMQAPEGKVFDCWEVNGERYKAGDKVVISGDTTIKALWKTPSKGLSGGAIAGIVIGSVVVVGVGGFALIWFVVLKKSGAALVELFKKIPAFFKGLFKKK